MNEKEILEGNKLIANSPFAGAAVRHEIQHHTESGNDIGLTHFYKNLRYHKDWNILIELLEAFEKMGCEFIISTGSIIITWDDGTAYYDRQFVGTQNKLHILYSMLAKLIKWYNTQSLPINNKI